MYGSNINRRYLPADIHGEICCLSKCIPVLCQMDSEVDWWWWAVMRRNKRKYNTSRCYIHTANLTWFILRSMSCNFDLPKAITKNVTVLCDISLIHSLRAVPSVKICCIISFLIKIIRIWSIHFKQFPAWTCGITNFLTTRIDAPTRII